MREALRNNVHAASTRAREEREEACLAREEAADAEKAAKFARLLNLWRRRARLRADGGPRTLPRTTPRVQVRDGQN